MHYSDIHIHGLYGVDDGAKTEKDMYTMLDASYRDGIRLICFTPHFHPGYFGDNIQGRDKAFTELKTYAKENYPDLTVALGNELHYSTESVSWLESGACLTMNGTNYVLVDFSEREEAAIISRAMNALLNAGYVPILAHVERYVKLQGKIKEIQCYKEDGVVLQMDTQSLFGKFGFMCQHRSKRLLKKRLIDIVSSDAHNLTTRPVGMAECYKYIAAAYGDKYARAVCRDNALYLMKSYERNE